MATKQDILNEIQAEFTKVGPPEWVNEKAEKAKKTGIKCYNVPILRTDDKGRGVQDTAVFYVVNEGEPDEEAYLERDIKKSAKRLDLETFVAGKVGQTVGDLDILKAWVVQFDDEQEFGVVRVYQLEVDNKVRQVNYFSYEDGGNWKFYEMK